MAMKPYRRFKTVKGKRVKSARWYFKYRDYSGKWIERAGTESFDDTDKMRSKLDSRSMQVREGTLDPREVQIHEHSRRPIVKVIEEYATFLASKADSQKHIGETVRLITRLAEAVNAQCLIDFDAPPVTSWLVAQGKAGRSQRTRNASLKAARAMTRWAVENRRVAFDPLAGVRPVKQTETVRTSRVMLLEEFDALIDSLRKKGREGERRAFYTLCAHTGLRWEEAERIRWVQVHLEERIINLARDGTKAKRDDIIPISDRLAKELELYRAKSNHQGPSVFTRQPRLRTWKSDLIAAGVVRPYSSLETREVVMAGYVTDVGQLDRKCLRKSYNVWLKHAGVDLSDRMTLMRHKDPRLTVGPYDQPRMPDLQSAVNSLSTPVRHPARTIGANAGQSETIRKIG